VREVERNKWEADVRMNGEEIPQGVYTSFYHLLDYFLLQS